MEDNRRFLLVHPEISRTKYNFAGIIDNEPLELEYIYAMLKGIDDSAARIAMAQRWSQDVCRQLGNNISDELVAQLKS